MNSWVRIGAKCVYVASAGPSIDMRGVVSIPVKGEIVTIRNVGFFESEVCVLLAEHVNQLVITTDGLMERWFFIRNFRPLIPIADDIALFTEIAKLSKLDQLATTLSELA